MSVEFKCQQCGRRFIASVSLKEKRKDAVVCPACGTATKSTIIRKRVRSLEPQPVLAPVPQPEPAKPQKKRKPLVAERPPNHVEDLVDMTAMVDIVFFLLIFFMVTSIQAMQAVMDMPPPQSNEPSPNQQVEVVDQTFINVTIEANDSIWVEDEEISGGQALRSKLRKLREENPALTGLVVTGDPEASHSTLVTVLDCGTDAGITELKFAIAGEEGG